MKQLSEGRTSTPDEQMNKERKWESEGRQQVGHRKRKSTSIQYKREDILG